MHQFLQFILFYFGIKLYMFRTVFPSIIRSSRLYIQQRLYIVPLCSHNADYMDSLHEPVNTLVKI